MNMKNVLKQSISRMLKWEFSIFFGMECCISKLFLGTNSLRSFKKVIMTTKHFDQPKTKIFLLWASCHRKLRHSFFIILKGKKFKIVQFPTKQKIQFPTNCNWVIKNSASFVEEGRKRDSRPYIKNAGEWCPRELYSFPALARVPTH